LLVPGAVIRGWAQLLGSGGASVTIGVASARTLLSLGLTAFRHATTLRLPSAEEEAQAWLWAGAMAEALGEMAAARAHYARSAALTEAPAPAVSLSRTLNALQLQAKAERAPEAEALAAEAVSAEVESRPFFPFQAKLSVRWVVLCVGPCALSLLVLIMLFSQRA